MGKAFNEDKCGFNFIPNIGVESLSFDMSEKDLLIFLMIKNNIAFEKQEYDDGEGDKSISYRFELNMNFITVFFHKEKEEDSYVSIHMDNLKVNKKELSTMNVEQLRLHLIEFHKLSNIKYQEKFEDNDLDISYSFNNIGLTVWFEDGAVSGICIEPVRQW